MTSPRLPTVRQTRGLHTTARTVADRLRQVPVPRYVNAYGRLWQAEVWAAGLTGLHLPEVARLHVGFPGRRGMLWHQLHV